MPAASRPTATSAAPGTPAPDSTSPTPSTGDRAMTGAGRPRGDPLDVPDEGRVRAVVVDGRTVALARCGGRLGALDNRCPHQGGPLGEGSIENGWLRCPWHGYDYDPISGRPPA